MLDWRQRCFLNVSILLSSIIFEESKGIKTSNRSNYAVIRETDYLIKISQ